LVAVDFFTTFYLIRELNRGPLDSASVTTQCLSFFVSNSGILHPAWCVSETVTYCDLSGSL